MKKTDHHIIKLSRKSRRHRRHRRRLPMKRLFDGPLNNVNVPPVIVDLPEEQSDVNPAFKIIDVLNGTSTTVDGGLPGETSASTMSTIFPRNLCTVIK